MAEKITKAITVEDIVNNDSIVSGLYSKLDAADTTPKEAPVEGIPVVGAPKGEFKGTLTPLKYTSPLFDIEDRQAQVQTLGEKWGRGTIKFTEQVGTGIIGTLGNIIYGTGAAVFNQDINKFFDNEFLRTLDGWDDATRERFKHYRTVQEREQAWYKSILGPGAANFWSDDVLGGLAFTVSAVASEAIASAITAATFGAGSGLQMGVTARIFSKASKLLNKSDDAFRALNTTSGLVKAGNAIDSVGVLTRQLYTGAFYEAGMEARGFKDEAWHKQFEEHGVGDKQELIAKLGEEAVANLEESINSASNWVFAGNSALVGFSNAITLPKTFGPGILKNSNGILSPTRGVLKNGKLMTAWDSWNRAQKIGYIGYKAGERAISEGLIEEGGQSLLSNAGLFYLKNTIDPKGTLDSYSAMDALHDAFADTYGNLENNQFWKEVGIGMIIGLIGSPTFQRGSFWQGSAFNAYGDTMKNVRKAQEIVEKANQSDLLEKFASTFKTANVINMTNEEMAEATAEGDIKRAKDLEETEYFSAFLQRYQLGIIETIEDNVVSSIEEMDINTFRNTFGYENMTEKELNARKKEVISKAKAKNDLITKHIRQAESIIRDADLLIKGTDTEGELRIASQDLIQAVAYTGYMKDNTIARRNTLAAETAQLLNIERTNLEEFAIDNVEIPLSKRFIRNKAKLNQKRVELESKLEEARRTWTGREDSTIDLTDKKDSWLNNLDKKIENYLGQLFGVDFNALEDYEKLSPKQEAEVDKALEAKLGLTNKEAKDPRAIRVLEKALKKVEDKLDDIDFKEHSRQTKIRDAKKKAAGKSRKEIQAPYKLKDYSKFKDHVERAVSVLEAMEQSEVSNPENISAVNKKMTDIDALVKQEEMYISHMRDLLSPEGSKRFIGTSKEMRKKASREAYKALYTYFGEALNKLGAPQVAQNILENIEDAEIVSEETETLPTPTGLDETSQQVVDIVTNTIDEYFNNPTKEDAKKTLDTIKRVKKDESLPQEVRDWLEQKEKEFEKEVTAYTKVLQKSKGILYSPQSFFRVINDIPGAVDSELLKSLGNKALNENLNLQVIDLTNAGEFTDPEVIDDNGLKVETGVKIKIGSEQGKALGLFRGKDLLGYLTDPDKFYYLGKPMDLRNEAHLKILLPNVVPNSENHEMLLRYQDAARVIFKKAFSGAKVSTKEITDVFNIYKDQSGYSSITNKEDRLTVQDFFNNNTENLIDVPIVGVNQKGIIILQQDNIYTVTPEEGELVVTPIEKINGVVPKFYDQIIKRAEAQNPRYREMHHATKAIVQQGSSMQFLGLDWGPETKVNNEALRKTIAAEISRLEQLNEDDWDRDVDGNYINSDFPFFINIRSPHQSTPKLNLHLNFYRKYDKTNNTYGKVNISATLTSPLFNHTQKGKENNKVIFTGLSVQNGEIRVSTSKTTDVEFTIESLANLFGNQMTTFLNTEKAVKMGRISQEFADYLDRIKPEISGISIRPETDFINSFVFASMPKSLSVKIGPSKLIKNGKANSSVSSNNTTSTKTTSKKTSGTRAKDLKPKNVDDEPTKEPIFVREDGDNTVFKVAPTVTALYRWNYKKKGPKDPRADYNWYDVFVETSIPSQHIDLFKKLYKEILVQDMAKGPTMAGGVVLRQQPTLETVLNEFNKQINSTSTKNTPAPDVQESATEDTTTTPTESRLERLKREFEQNSNSETEDDVALATEENITNEIVSNQEMMAILQRILPIKSAENPKGLIEIGDLSRVISRLRANGQAFGAFYKNIIYLNTKSNQINKGTIYHEAFHAVFRTLFTNKERAEIIAQAIAEGRISEPTSKMLAELKTRSVYYVKYTESELRELSLEEQLADVFAGYAVKKDKEPSILRRIWNSITKWFKSLTPGNTRSLDEMFSDIYHGAYKFRDGLQSSKMTEPAFSLLRHKSGFITSKNSSIIISRIVNQMMRRGTPNTEEDFLNWLEESLLEVKAYYDPAAWENDIEAMTFDNIGVEALERIKDNKLNRIIEIYDAIPTDKSESNYKIVKEEVIKVLNTINSFDELKDIEELSEAPPRSFDEILGEHGGYQTVNKLMKTYLLTTSFQADEFGLNLSDEQLQNEKYVVPVNVYHLYNVLSHGLLDVEESKMMRAFKLLSENDPSAKAFYNTLTSHIASELGEPDFEAVKDKITESNLYNSFINTFRKRNHIINERLYDKETGKVTRINTNKRYDAQQLFTEWKLNFEVKNGAHADYNRMADKIDELRPVYLLGETDIAEFIRTLDERALKVRDGLDEAIQMNLSSAYVKWSIVRDNLEKIEEYYFELERKGPSEELTIVDELLQDNSAFNVNSLNMQFKYANTNELRSLLFDILPSKDQLRSPAIENKNPYIGSAIRIGYIAKANMQFDNTIRKTTFQNIEGNNVHTVVNYSFLSDMMQILSSTEFKGYIKDITNKSAKDLKVILNKFGIDYHFDILKLYHNSFLHNPLFRDQALLDEFLNHDFILQYDGGTREASFNEDESLNTKKDFKKGNTFGHASAKEKLFNALADFAEYWKNDQTKNQTKKAPINFQINEAKSQGFSIDTHVKNYFEKGLPTNTAVEDYYQLFLQDFNRRRIVSKMKLKLEKYNIEESDRGFSLKSIIWMQKDPAFVELYNQILNVKNIDVNLELDIKTAITKHLLNIVNSHIDLLKETRLVDEKGDAIGLDREYWMDPSSQEDKSLNKTRFGTAILNDYISSKSLINMFDIDPDFGTKGFVDFVKRNAGKVAYGDSFGRGQSSLVVLKDIEKRGINTTDAQSYNSLDHRILYLKRKGRYNNRVKYIYENKIRLGLPLEENELKFLHSEGALLQSLKLVGKDMLIYLKTSTQTLTRSLTSEIIDPSIGRPSATTQDVVIENLQNLYRALATAVDAAERRDILEEIHSYYKPKEGKEVLHALLNKMELNNTDIVAFESAIKTSMPITTTLDGDFTPNFLNNMFLREQVNTDGFKHDILQGVQMMQLIWSEQNQEKSLKINGKDYKIKALKEFYQRLLADRIDSGVSDIERKLFEGGDINLGKKKFLELYRIFRENQGHADPLLIELFSVSDPHSGKADYNPNYAAVAVKFHNMFLAYVSKMALKHKVRGAKYTLASSYGHQELKYDSETGEAEVLISSYVAGLYNLKEGSTIPDAIAKQLGFRIPTQDKHSMIKLKVVGLLPPEYSNTIITNDEIIRLSGADFDIDSLFARFKETYEGFKEFGSYRNAKTEAEVEKQIYIEYKHSKKLKEDFKEVLNTIAGHTLELLDEEQFAEYRKQFYKDQQLDTLANFKRKYAEIIYQGKKNWKAESLTSIKPITNEERSNLLFDIEYEFIHNEHNRQIATQPASMTTIEDSINDYIKLGLLKVEEGIDVNDPNAYKHVSPLHDQEHSLLAKYYSNKANEAGKRGIGPAAVANIINQLLIDQEIELNNLEIFGRSSFAGFLTEDGKRKNDINSTAISAMTDNAKLLYSEYLNLNDDTIAHWLIMVGLNMPPQMGLDILQSDAYRLYVENKLDKKLSITLPEIKLDDYLADTYGEVEEDEILEVPLNETTIREALKFKTAFQNNGKVTKEDSTLTLGQYKFIQAKIADQITKIEKINSTFVDIRLVLSAMKGISADEGGTIHFLDVVESLGITINKDGSISKTPEEKKFTYIDFYKIAKNVPYIESNIKAVSKIHKMLGKYLVSHSPLGAEVLRAAQKNMNISRFEKVEVLNKLMRDFVSYLGLHASYQKGFAQKADYKIMYDDNLAEEIRALQSLALDPTSPIYQNSFLRNIKVVEKESHLGKMYLIQSNTRVLKDPDVHQELLQGFKDLMLNPVTREVAKGLIQYLATANALQYANRSFISYISPKFLTNTFFPGLDAASDAFNAISDEGQFRKTFGKNFKFLKNEFIYLASLDQSNQRNMRYNHKNTLVAFASNAIRKNMVLDREEVPRELTQDDYIKRSPIGFTKNGDVRINILQGLKSEDFTGSPEQLKKVLEQLDNNAAAIGQSGIVSLIKREKKNKKKEVTTHTMIGFPLIIKINESTKIVSKKGQKFPGSREVYYKLDLSSVRRNLNSKGQLATPIEVGADLVEGYSAYYRPINRVSNWNFSFYGMTMKEVEQYYKDVEQYKKDNAIEAEEEYIVETALDIDDAAEKRFTLEDAQKRKEEQEKAKQTEYETDEEELSDEETVRNFIADLPFENIANSEQNIDEFVEVTAEKLRVLKEEYPAQTIDRDMRISALLMNARNEYDGASSFTLSLNNDFVGEEVTKDKYHQDQLVAVLDNLKRKFGINWRFDDTILQKGKFANGIVLINPKLATKDTPFHEYAHPFVAAVKKHNRAAYDNVWKELMRSENGRKLYKKIQYIYRNTYSFDNMESFKDETIVTALGMNSALFAGENKTESLKQAIKNFWNAILDIIKELVGSGKTISIKDLPTNITIKDLTVLLTAENTIVPSTNDHIENIIDQLSKCQ